VDHWRSGRERFLRIYNYWQRVIFHINQIERIPRCVAIFGHYNGHSLADVANFIDGKNVVFGYSESWIVRGSRKRADLIAQLGAGENSHDAGMPARRIRVDALDLGVRVRAPENHDVKHMRELDIVHVLAEAANQTGIFAPFDAGANGFA